MRLRGWGVALGIAATTGRADAFGMLGGILDNVPRSVLGGMPGRTSGTMPGRRLDCWLCGGVRNGELMIVEAIVGAVRGIKC